MPIFYERDRFTLTKDNQTDVEHRSPQEPANQEDTPSVPIKRRKKAPILTRSVHEANAKARMLFPTLRGNLDLSSPHTRSILIARAGFRVNGDFTELVVADPTTARRAAFADKISSGGTLDTNHISNFNHTIDRWAERLDINFAASSHFVDELIEELQLLRTNPIWERLTRQQRIDVGRKQLPYSLALEIAQLTPEAAADIAHDRLADIEKQRILQLQQQQEIAARELKQQKDQEKQTREIEARKRTVPTFDLIDDLDFSRRGARRAAILRAAYRLNNEGTDFLFPDLIFAVNAAFADQVVLQRDADPNKYKRIWSNFRAVYYLELGKVQELLNPGVSLDSHYTPAVLAELVHLQAHPIWSRLDDNKRFDAGYRKIPFSTVLEKSES